MDEKCGEPESAPNVRRRLQFSVRELLGLVTIAAVACSLVRWLGPTGIILLYVGVGPVSAIAFLIARKTPLSDELLLFGGTTTGSTWSALQLYFAVSADDSAPADAWPVLYVVVPVIMGVFGVYAGTISAVLISHLYPRRQASCSD